MCGPDGNDSVGDGNDSVGDGNDSVGDGNDEDPDLAPPDADDALVLAPDCARCPALVDARTRISWGTGPRDADVLVVGEAPGTGDPDPDADWGGGNHTGLAYTSRHSGRRVRRLFASLGYDPFYTNAVKCLPADGDGGTREPTAAERANCRPHLEREVAVVDPAVVVATGRTATASLLAFDGRDLDGFLERVLDPVRVDALDVEVLPILHPSYQDVWIARLGYEPDEYRRAVGERLP